MAAWGSEGAWTNQPHSAAGVHRRQGAACVGHKVEGATHPSLLTGAQVAAYCNGRERVSQYDCLLLEHVLWNKPEQAERISDWLLAQLAVDDGIKQVQYLLNLGKRQGLTQQQLEGRIESILGRRVGVYDLTKREAGGVIDAVDTLSKQRAAAFFQTTVAKFRTLAHHHTSLNSSRNLCTARE